MSHHSDKPIDPEMEEAMNRFAEGIKEAVKEGQFDDVIGPTGQFPEGKISEDDKGELTFSLGVKDCKVIIDFNQPIYWIGMNTEDAKHMGKNLIRLANEIENKTGQK